MEYKLYGLKTCDTCRKAAKELIAAGHEVHQFDVRRDGISENTLRELLAEYGADIVVNKRSTTWRGQSEAERNADPLGLLLDHPSLMKRPVVIGNGQAWIGWGKAVHSALLS